MRKPPTRNLILIRILTAVSAVVSTYLLVTSLRGGIVAGCGPASGCEDVLASRWGLLAGIARERTGAADLRDDVRCDVLGDAGQRRLRFVNER